MRFLIILLFVIFSTKIFSIENNKLISENDLNYLFDNSQKKWNETIVFLDKKFFGHGPKTYRYFCSEAKFRTFFKDTHENEKNIITFNVHRDTGKVKVKDLFFYSNSLLHMDIQYL